MIEDFAIGLDIGGTSVKGVAVTREGRLLSAVQETFDPARAMHFAETTRDLCRVLETAGPNRPCAIGVCAPGLPDKAGTTITHLSARLPGMCGLDWSAYLEAGRAVPVMNDAQAALLAETWLGAARDKTDVLLLTLGTGVGGAAMVDGHLLRGHLGRAGHVGHISLDPHGRPDICRTPGSLEEAVGNCTIQERSGGRFTSTLDLIRAHLDGDAAATTVWLESVRALAAGIVSLANVLDPEVVVIGGGIAAAGEALFTPLRKRVDEMEWKIGDAALRVVPAQLGDKAGAHGAARNALLNVK